MIALVTLVHDNYLKATVIVVITCLRLWNYSLPLLNNNLLINSGWETPAHPVSTMQCMYYCVIFASIFICQLLDLNSATPLHHLSYFTFKKKKKSIVNIKIHNEKHKINYHNLEVCGICLFSLMDASGKKGPLPKPWHQPHNLYSLQDSVCDVVCIIAVIFTSHNIFLCPF